LVSYCLEKVHFLIGYINCSGLLLFLTRFLHEFKKLEWVKVILIDKIKEKLGNPQTMILVELELYKKLTLLLIQILRPFVGYSFL